jgi:hypothetical protein
MPVILTTQETEVRRIVVQSQPRQIVHKTLSWKKPISKKGFGGRREVARKGVGGWM